MTRIPPAGPARLEELRDTLERQHAILGFVSESVLTMAHRPGIAVAFIELVAEVMGPGAIAPELKRLVALVSSAAAGCRYCQAHAAHSAERVGADATKVTNALLFEESPAFTDAERAALAYASAASVVPNQVADHHLVELRSWFSAEQIVEITSVVALHGWLNRWNDSLATTLEEPPLLSARHLLKAGGWSADKHAPERPLPPN